MGWLRLVGSLKLYVSFAKEPYKRDYILQKRVIILRSLLIVATPYYSLSHLECHIVSFSNQISSCLIHIVRGLLAHEWITHLECHFMSFSNPNLMGLFSTERGISSSLHPRSVEKRPIRLGLGLLDVEN